MERSFFYRPLIGSIVSVTLFLIPVTASSTDYTNPQGTTITSGMNLSNGDTYTNEGTIAISGVIEDIFYILGAGAEITNTGTGAITSNASSGRLIYSEFTTNTVLSNQGTVNFSGDGAYLVYSVGNTAFPASLSEISNSGTISSTGESSYVIYNDQSSTLETFDNSGTMSATTAVLENKGSVNTFTNESTGTLSGSTTGISNAGTISALYNAGIIQSTGEIGIYNNGGTITSLTNTGSISGNTYGIDNAAGTITTLINAQNNLSYTGTLPGTYKVILTDSTHYGKLNASAVTGSPFTFGISTCSQVTSQLYTAVLTGIDTSQLNNTTGTFGQYSYELVPETGQTNIWDLYFPSYQDNNNGGGGNAQNTLMALNITRQDLEALFNLESTTVTTGLDYDCRQYDKHHVCLSAGAQYTNTTGSSFTSARIGAAYQFNRHARLGGFVDPLLYANLSSGLHLRDDIPRAGIFTAWAENLSGKGYEIRASVNAEREHLDVTRTVLSGTEPGTGVTSLSTQAEYVTMSYGFPITLEWLITPYLGARHMLVKTSAYQETPSGTVESPLSYQPLSQKSNSAVLGLRILEKTGMTLRTEAIVGIERDIQMKVTDYTATGITGLTPISFNPHIRKTRGLASIGGEYAFLPGHRLEFNALYRQESFEGTHTVTAVLRYTARF